jgi:ribosomal-protein-alanine N-acetyltransferase
MLKITNIKKVGEIIFRPMSLHDVANVHKVESRCYDYPWSEKLIYDCVTVGYYCWLVEYQHKVIGYAIYRLAAGEAHLFNIAVDPSYQNKGICRAFLGYLLDQMRTQKAKKVMLEVRVSNAPARKLYQSFNFKEVGIRKGYYPDENDTREDGLNLELEF